jgi:hypothetical protein
LDLYSDLSIFPELSIGNETELYYGVGRVAYGARAPQTFVQTDGSASVCYIGLTYRKSGRLKDVPLERDLGELS